MYTYHHLQGLQHSVLVFLHSIPGGTGGGQTTHALQRQVPAVQGNEYHYHKPQLLGLSSRSRTGLVKMCVGHCNSVKHEYETIQIFWGARGVKEGRGVQGAPHCMKLLG